MKTETKHTPDWTEAIDNDVYFNTECVAQCASPQIAQLFAAAPETAAERDRLKRSNAEMLLTLQFVLDRIENASGKIPLNGSTISTIRAAIAKAEAINGN